MQSTSGPRRALSKGKGAARPRRLVALAGKVRPRSHAQSFPAAYARYRSLQRMLAIVPCSVCSISFPAAYARYRSLQRMLAILPCSVFSQSFPAAYARYSAVVVRMCTHPRISPLALPRVNPKERKRHSMQLLVPTLPCRLTGRASSRG
jgi:hypothetical protein